MNGVNAEGTAPTVVTGEQSLQLDVGNKGGKRKGLFSQSNRNPPGSSGSSGNSGMNKVLEEMRKMNSMMERMVEMQKQMDVGVWDSIHLFVYIMIRNVSNVSNNK